MEVKGEESCRNKDRLGQCLIGKWDPKAAGGGDLERMGWMLARAWGLRGRLGLAWMGEGRALLEFEKAAEARRILDGDLEEEAWVRVKGLPLSLWTPSILRKVGDVCEGFVAMDGPTERMEDLRWARILVKTKRGVWPSSIEIEIDKTTFLLPMWWEVMPVFRKKKEDCRSAEGCEEGDDGDARAGRRVEKGSSADFEVQSRSDDVTDGLQGGKGKVLSGGPDPIRVADPGNHPSPTSGGSRGGLGSIGRIKGPKGKEKAQEENHGSREGFYKVQNWDSGPSLSGFQEKGAQRGGPLQNRSEVEVREMETVFAQKSTEEWADSALHEEVMRYEALSFLGGLWVSGNSSSSSMFSFGRTPEGEFFDHSGKEGRSVKLTEIRKGKRQRAPGPVDGRGEKELDWQESSLARFSLFLGFSTDGMEKEILNFLSKIRKRREKIHSKGLLEKSRFERELKRLECSVNYEGDSKKKGSFQGKGMQMMKQKVDLFCIQETKIQLMFESVVRSLGSGRFLEWKALNACGSVGGMLICWDKEFWSCWSGRWGSSLYPADLKLWRMGGNQRNLGGALVSRCDFNITLAQGERNRQGRITSAMRSFSRVCQRRLPRPISDHFPVLLEGGSWSKGPAPFRFENMWFKVEGFKELIRNWWQETVEFGNLESNKEAAMQQVDFWDRVEEERSLSMEESACKKEAKEAYAKWVDWKRLIGGRRANHMDRIKINGITMTEERDVREGIVKAFKQQFSESPEWKADIGGLSFNQICVQEAEMLETPFSEEEVLTALMEMNGDKAPGPDGFSVFFWQRCWDFIKEEILELFKEFHDQNTFLKSINNTFLVLIPKKGGAEDFGDFRPISLLGGLYKLVAKVLANRLKKVIDKVVSHDQNAFVKGRQILDASLIGKTK
ncbi:LINE-1 retrotransposable element ORF2 protein [Vitis vinifera]|uniref:LINE-1 retrotransposable element ORF2 protein n=1 Tax=Vitis vinifera TaxID=29760 RepID=A0A438DYK8_VITVI|nr:LINE-1 retrotransposable element ORF2 protein [Vitis vinifera]